MEMMCISLWRISVLGNLVDGAQAQARRKDSHSMRGLKILKEAGECPFLIPLKIIVVE
ncbi:hypothetical protein Scep_016243 [Stephania cephalantha]|uniref:Uncharacterized protein n=1 Tax=Stephania cephalantha TaxID=152367 RepID=A0AAP0NUG2_9MAGN